MHKIFWKLSLFLPTILLASGLQGQGAGTDPVKVAARYVLATWHDQLADLGPELVVDTHRPGFRRPPLSPQMQARTAQLAAALKARPGRLEDLLVCPAELPPPELFGRRGCRLVGGARAVLQVDESVVAEEELLVTVTIWSYHEVPERDSYWVAAVAREIKLGRDAAGKWQVTGTGITSHARWW